MQNNKIFSGSAGVGRRCSAFTLIELVMVIALVSVSLLFLTKVTLFSHNEEQQISNAISLLASFLDNARGEAIAGNTYTQIAIDISSDYKFRRLIKMKQINGFYYSESEIFLPDRTFVMSISDLSSKINNKDLSQYAYDQSIVKIRGKEILIYSFIFSPNGQLISFSNTNEGKSAIFGVSCGYKNGDKIVFKPETEIRGIFITRAGQQVILKSRKNMEEVL